MPHPDFSRIIYALQEPVLLVEPGGTIVGGNARASRLFRRPSSRLFGKRLTALVTDDPQKLTQYLRQCSQNSAGLPGGVRANVALVPGGSDVEPFWLNVVENITAHKVAEQALGKTQAELAHVSRLTTMGELAASIAHEINQPLTAVTNNGNACLRLLADHNLQPEVVRRALQEIVTEATHASAVIARIRAFIMKEPAEKIELGMGLSISRSVVEGLGGRLWAKPNVPYGAVFSFTLPIAAEGSYE